MKLSTEGSSKEGSLLRGATSPGFRQKEIVKFEGRNLKEKFCLLKKFCHPTRTNYEVRRNPLLVALLCSI